MDNLATKVSHAVARVKKAILIPYYEFMQSNRGHKCMRSFGPFVSLMFYITQLLHAVYFYCEIAPSLSLKYAKRSPMIIMMWLALGWFLFFKVTYTYWYVSTSDPGSPNDLKRD